MLDFSQAIQALPRNVRILAAGVADGKRGSLIVALEIDSPTAVSTFCRAICVVLLLLLLFSLFPRFLSLVIAHIQKGPSHQSVCASSVLGRAEVFRAVRTFGGKHAAKTKDERPKRRTLMGAVQTKIATLMTWTRWHRGHQDDRNFSLGAARAAFAQTMSSSGGIGRLI